ncbi:MAG TPA: TolC family protein [Flavobacteriia bacterium]|nr:TolC family protein [Flavobacteriia bacterium]
MKKAILLLLVILSQNSIAQQKFSLDEAVTYAQKNAYAVKNAKLDIDKAIKKKWETTTMGLPQINGKVDYQNFIKQPVSLIPAQFFGGAPGEFAEVSFGTKQNLNASATLSQLIFDGSYLVGLQSAKVYLTISKLADEKTQKSIKEAVILAYGNVLLTKESITILKNNIKLLEKNIHDTQKIYENGFAQEQDVEQLQITLSNLKNQLQKTESLLAISKKMLGVTIGFPIESEFVLTDDLNDLAKKNTSLELLNASFNLDNHIDYKMEMNNIKAKELFIKLEKSKKMPSVATFLNYALTANNDKFGFFNSNQKWFDSSVFGVSINIPVFTSFKTNSRIQQAKIDLQKEQNNLTEIQEKLKLQVEKAKTDYNFAIANFQNAKKRMVLAKRIEKKEQIKFFEGVGSSFNLTQAQQQLYTTQQNYLQAIVQIIQTKAKLETALNL